MTVAKQSVLTYDVSEYFTKGETTPPVHKPHIYTVRQQEEHI